MEVNFKKFSSRACLLTSATPGSACLMSAHQDVSL